MKTPDVTLREFQKIPGVGPSIARDLVDLGYKNIDSLNLFLRLVMILLAMLAMCFGSPRQICLLTMHSIVMTKKGSWI